MQEFLPGRIPGDIGGIEDQNRHEADHGVDQGYVQQIALIQNKTQDTDTADHHGPDHIDGKDAVRNPRTDHRPEQHDQDQQCEPDQSPLKKNPV